MKKGFGLGFVILAGCLAGCGHSETMHVGEEGQKGVIVRDKEAANDVAAKQTALEKSGQDAADGK